MEDTVLTIAERLKDLRKARGLTLEALAEAVSVSKSALGTYETADFKDISPFSIVKLAKFYGVTADYLMGVSNMEMAADAEIQELHLTNDALNVLNSGHFSGKSTKKPVNPCNIRGWRVFLCNFPLCFPFTGLKRPS